MKNVIALVLFFAFASAPVLSHACGKHRVHSVKMERTPCLGTCPWYIVKVYEDGRVTYWGKEGTPREGFFEGRIDPLEADALMEKFEKKRIHKAQDQYNKNIADIPMLHFQFTLGKDMEEKNIKQANFGPTYLLDLGKEIDLLIKNVQWKRATNDDVE